MGTQLAAMLSTNTDSNHWLHCNSSFSLSGMQGVLKATVEEGVITHILQPFSDPQLLPYL